MILHRVTFHARFGKADDVVAYFKEALSNIPEEQLAHLRPRILTDISGRFDTVQMETFHESLAAYEQFRTMVLERNTEDGDSNPILALVESGQNEYFTVEMMIDQAQ